MRKEELQGGSGCVGLGCLGGFLGMLVASWLVSLFMHNADKDTQSWAGLFFGLIPGVLLGGLVWAAIRARSGSGSGGDNYS